jgi:exopolysaccharide biosynthesis polyprenyl glycosylphosphotransferase
MLRISTHTERRPDLRASNVLQFCRGIKTQWARVLLLFTVDALVLSLAWRLAERFGTPGAPSWSVQNNPISLLLILGTVMGVFITSQLYRSGELRRDYVGIIRAMTVAVSLLLLVAYIYQPSEFISRSHLILFWLFSAVFVCLGRYGIDQLTETLRAQGNIRYNVFLICDPEYLEQSIQLITRENRYNVMGIADARSLDRAMRDRTLTRIRSLGTVEAFVSWDAIHKRQHLWWHFRTAGIKLHVIPHGLEPLLNEPRFRPFQGFPTLSFAPPMLTGFDFALKQVFDYCAALILILIISPLYLLIAIAIRIDSSGPIFYRQTRIGLQGTPFQVWKFRTMVTNADQLQKQLEAQNQTKDGILFKIKDDPRITRVGRFLRQYSLDELPQLFNVLMGEMSLVGPRPLPLRDVQNFLEHHFIRQEVLPGITGLWQVSGRSDIDDFEQVVGLDLFYIENWSLWLDLKILLCTIRVVFQKAGAY